MDSSLLIAPRALLSLIILNVALLLAGLMLIVSGFFLEGQRHMVFDIYSGTFSLALFLLLTICITVGLLSANLPLYKSGIQANSCQNIAMSTGVVLICTLELAAFLSGTVMRTQVEEKTRANLFTELKLYNRSLIYMGDQGDPVEENMAHANRPQKSRNYLDILQTWLQCCGVDSPTDWRYHFPKGHVPDSCCMNPRLGCGNGVSVNASKVFDNGCIVTFDRWMDHDVLLFSVASFVLCFLQLTSMFTLFWLKKKLSNRRIIAPI